MGLRIEFDGEVRRWQARTESWFFADLPEGLSDDLRELPSPRRGFGSLRVSARIGGSEWTTSIFPGTGGYALPLKRAVREAERLSEGDVVEVTLDILDL